MINEEEIRKDAKRILDEFSSALKELNIKNKRFKKKIGGYRVEGKGNISDKYFRESMFKNAPKKNNDCIIAKRKKW